MVMGLWVFVCFEGEGCCFSAAFQNKLFGISLCCFLWEKISKEKKGWSGMTGNEGTGEERMKGERKQLEDRGDK